MRSTKVSDLDISAADTVQRRVSDSDISAADTVQRRVSDSDISAADMDEGIAYAERGVKLDGCIGKLSSDSLSGQRLSFGTP
jgi:hypothetical protein